MIRLLPLLLAACSPPDPGELFASVTATVEPDGDSADAPLVAVAASAKTELRVALPAGETTAVTNAILAAWDDGVDVEVVTDVDQAEDPGIAALIDANVPVKLADGSLGYFDFSSNLDVLWDSTQVRMSNGWVVADHQRLAVSTLAGSAETGPRVVFEARGEDLIDDVLSEQNQIFGGTDATALDAYSNSSKSVLDTRWAYGTTDDAKLGVWFGPQERLTKRVIDAVYGARSSIRVMTSDLSNDGLAKALQHKAANGFPVEVIVGASQGLGSSAEGRTLTESSPDVVKYQRSDVDQLPTVVLVDFEQTRLGQHSTARAMVLTHALVSSARVWQGTEVESDQIIDGSLWELFDGGDPTPAMQSLADLLDAERDAAQELP
jgi:hypothetical protein